MNATQNPPQTTATIATTAPTAAIATEPLTLAGARCGEVLNIISLSSSSEACQRLRELGFCEKSQVYKVSDNGTLICSMLGTRVAISRELGSQIMVERVPRVREQLSSLPCGTGGRVAGFDGAPEVRQRLLEMGLTPGAEFEIVRFAPMGDPIEIKVRGYHLSLRKSEAQGILVVLN